MFRLARQLLAASLVALHATVMLCGPCLHELSGWGHEVGLSRAADSGQVSEPVKATHLQPDDCPVCHFLSQAQLPVDAPIVLSVWHVRFLNPELLCDSVTPSLLHPTSPRAPPALAATVS
jgi:hypothetical protein